MSTKVGDVCVKTGTYKKGDEDKNRYKNIGSLMRNDDGGHFILLDATVISTQLFALSNRTRDTHIICSVFEEKKEGQQQAQQPSDGGGDIPF